MKTLTKRTPATFLINNEPSSAETYDSFVRLLLPDKFDLSFEDNPDGSSAQLYKLKDQNGNSYEVMHHVKSDHTQTSISKIKNK